MTRDEAASSIETLRDEFEELFKSHSWSLEYKWSDVNSLLPGIPVTVTLDYISDLATRVRSLTEIDLDRDGLRSFIGKIPAILENVDLSNFYRQPDPTYGGIMSVLQVIDTKLPKRSIEPVVIDWEDVNDKALIPKSLATRIRALEARLLDFEPRSAEIGRKITEIDQAHEAAERLPEDMAELRRKRSQLDDIMAEALDLLKSTSDCANSMAKLADESIQHATEIKDMKTQAEGLITKSESALRGATGVGLSGSFKSRKLGLSVAAGAWVAGLVGALFATYLVGSERVATLQKLITNDSRPDIIWMNLLLAILGVGGPIWFAWVATKQIVTTLKLAEDYAFKAAVSMAYEGYRNEATQIDPLLRHRLFASALDRLEEAPIRLMDKEIHGSPLQEILSNPAIRKSLESIPGISEKILALIPGKGAAVTAAVAVPSVLMAAQTPANDIGEEAQEKAAS